MFSSLRRRLTLFFPAAQRSSDDDTKSESRQHEGGVQETWTFVNNSSPHDDTSSNIDESSGKASPSVKNRKGSTLSTLPPAKKQKKKPSRPAPVRAATVSSASSENTSLDNFYTTNSAMASRDGDHALLPSPLLDPNRKCPSSRNYFPVSALNSHGRIGIYSPQERKVRLDQFRNKRKLRNFRKRCLHPSRHRIAMTRPRGHGGKFVTNSTT